jgi:threonine/homoserine/homoserine lactone efflux protein
MIEAALQGISLGLILAAMIGPAFFMLLQIAIEKNFKEAVYFACGIALSDAAYITLAIIGLSQVLSNSAVKPIMGYAGSIMLIAFGLSSFFKKVKNR